MDSSEEISDLFSGLPLHEQGKPRMQKVGIYTHRRTEKLLQDIAHDYTNEFKFAEERELFPDFKSVNGVWGAAPATTWTMGRFYEILTQAMYGGYLLKVPYPTNGTRNLFDNNVLGAEDLPGSNHKPDGASSRIVWDSKAWQAGTPLELWDGQVYNYLTEEQQDHRRFFFSLFVHNFHGIKTKARHSYTEESIIDAFCKGTAYSIRLPLEVIAHLHDRGNGYVLRGQHPGKGEVSHLSSQVAEMLMRHPMQFLASTGLDVRMYDIKRNLVRGATVPVTGDEMKPFPLLEIRKKSEVKEEELPF